MASWFERNRYSANLKHVFEPIPIGSNVFFQRDIHCNLPWQRAVIAEHILNAGATLHYKVILTDQGGMSLVVEHFRVAPMVIRVRLPELENGSSAEAVPTPITLGDWQDSPDASSVRFGGALPVAWHPDSKQMTVLWLNHFGRPHFNPFALVNYDPRDALINKRYDIVLESFERCLSVCSKRHGIGLTYFIDVAARGQPRELKSSLFAAFFPVSDEYAVTVLPDAEQPWPRRPKAAPAILSGSFLWQHAGNAAFVAMARLPGPAQEEAGVLPLSRSDDDVDVRVLSGVARATLGISLGPNSNNNSNGGDSSACLSRKDVKIQRWFEGRVPVKEARLSHNCILM